jgi:hypothetical protein
MNFPIGGFTPVAPPVPTVAFHRAPVAMPRVPTETPVGGLFGTVPTT